MFSGEKIKFRKLVPADAEVYHEWRNDFSVMRSTSPYLDLYSSMETEEFVTMISTSPNAKSYMIETKENVKPIGVVSLINLDFKNRSAECIIDIGDKSMWGKGIGFEAMSLLVHYAFSELNLHRLSLQVFSFNQNAISLYEKLGFKVEGQSREALYRDGQYHDVILMGLLKDEAQLEIN